MGGQRATVPLHRVGRRGHQIHLAPGKVGHGPMEVDDDPFGVVPTAEHRAATEKDPST